MYVGCYDAAGNYGSDSITVNYSTITCYQDADNDLYGHGVSQTVTSCSSGYYEEAHFVSLTGDCNDNNAGITPEAIDICGNGVDEDCSGSDAVCSVQGRLKTNGSARMRAGTGRLRDN